MDTNYSGTPGSEILQKNDGAKCSKPSGMTQDSINEMSIADVIKTIRLKLLKRQFEEVILLCQNRLKYEDVNTATLHYYLAAAMNGIKNFDAAIENHKRALELNGSLADIRNKKSKYNPPYDENEVACIGCGNQGYDVVFVTNQSVSEDNRELIHPIRRWVKCSQCGLVYANPMPGADALNRYYCEIATEKFGGIYGNIDDRFQFLVELSNKRLEKIEAYMGGAIQNKSLLDIGAGIGIFTGTALDRGWMAEGLELTPDDCRYAKRHFCLDLKQEDFYHFKTEEKYDAVTLFEVIEHLRHPLADLKQIHRLVKDNGVLVVATPILDSLYGKRMKERNVFWNVVTHLSYFERDVMTAYLKTAGFNLLEINLSGEGKGRMEFYCRKNSEPHFT